jgi:frataxin-like iron-binding protein CyaY
LHLLDAEIETQLVPDCVHGVDFNRGETIIQLRVDGRSVIVRAHAWPDHWVWIDARHSVRGGWRWQFTTQGKFVSAGGARALVANVEKMLRTAQRPAAEVAEAMHAIWRGCLIGGARRIA